MLCSFAYWINTSFLKQLEELKEFVGLELSVKSFVVHLTWLPGFSSNSETAIAMTALDILFDCSWGLFYSRFDQLYFVFDFQWWMSVEVVQTHINTRKYINTQGFIFTMIWSIFLRMVSFQFQWLRKNKFQREYLGLLREDCVINAELCLLKTLFQLSYSHF